MKVTMADQLPASYAADVQFLRIAREVAMDLNDIETILKNYQLTSEQWQTISHDPRFLRLLEGEIAAWNAAGNTSERTRLKAGMLIEEWLTEANARVHDAKEPLAAKTEVVKLLARIADICQDRGGPVGGGERFQITINLGASSQLKFTKEAPPKVIEGDVDSEQ